MLFHRWERQTFINSDNESDLKSVLPRHCCNITCRVLSWARTPGSERVWDLLLKKLYIYFPPKLFCQLIHRPVEPATSQSLVNPRVELINHCTFLKPTVSPHSFHLFRSLSGFWFSPKLVAFKDTFVTIQRETDFLCCCCWFCFFCFPKS